MPTSAITHPVRRVIALGFFDGVHQAHGALLSRAVERARELEARPCAFTFDTHPSSRLTGQSTPLLNSVEDRAWLMEYFYGIQEVLLASFEAMMELSWEEFISRYLIREQGAVHVVCGHDFRFGHRGEGTPQLLQQRCRELGIGCDVISRIELEGITVSSTYIRSVIAQGDMERAERFLGHPHVLSQLVAPGKRLGRTLGFPTVNLRFQPGLVIPSFGVYATMVQLEDGSFRMAVTNIGVRPTVDDDETPNAEAYILGYEGNLYGQRVRLLFFRKLREERKFHSLEALQQEVLRNAQQTREYFEGWAQLL
ncbi:MAG: riboflavin biosynthesis protein RibF [Oscillospiraceae bacterium]|nr:riboflavin biosynthesis protein RibF [Oscillospiraceae bacterium]